MRRTPHWPVSPPLGVVQIFTWGSRYYLMAILAGPIVEDTGWPLPWVIGTISLALTVAGLAAPHVGIWIVGQERYPALIGRLARPSLLAQAAAPILGGILVAGWGSSATLWVIAVLAAVNVAFAVFFFIQSRHRI